MYRASLVAMEMALRRSRCEEVEYACAGVADGVVAGEGCSGGGGVRGGGEGVGDEEGGAVDFREVAAFDVFLEGEGGYEGCCGWGFFGYLADVVGWLESRLDAEDGGHAGFW